MNKNLQQNLQPLFFSFLLLLSIYLTPSIIFIQQAKAACCDSHLICSPGSGSSCSASSCPSDTACSSASGGDVCCYQEKDQGDNDACYYSCTSYRSSSCFQKPCSGDKYCLQLGSSDTGTNGLTYPRYGCGPVCSGDYCNNPPGPCEACTPNGDHGCTCTTPTPTPTPTATPCNGCDNGQYAIGSKKCSAGNYGVVNLLWECVSCNQWSLRGCYEGTELCVANPDPACSPIQTPTPTSTPASTPTSTPNLPPPPPPPTPPPTTPPPSLCPDGTVDCDSCGVSGSHCTCSDGSGRGTCNSNFRCCRNP